MNPKLVILDRDGVINADSEAFIKSSDEWRPLGGSLEAIVRLKHAGMRVVVASNQSGIGCGLFGYDDLFSIHDKMKRMLADRGVALDGVLFCPHRPGAGCRCRKPAPGMLKEVSRRWNVPAADCCMIGDRLTDIQAARAAGVRAVGVRSGKPLNEDDRQWADVPIYANLLAAAEAIIDS